MQFLVVDDSIIKLLLGKGKYDMVEIEVECSLRIADGLWK